MLGEPTDGPQDIKCGQTPNAVLLAAPQANCNTGNLPVGINYF